MEAAAAARAKTTFHLRLKHVSVAGVAYTSTILQHYHLTAQATFTLLLKQTCRMAASLLRRHKLYGRTKTQCENRLVEHAECALDLKTRLREHVRMSPTVDKWSWIMKLKDLENL